jgi:arylsulfatase A-like enzyme
VVAEAGKFLEKHRASGKPMFSVIWFGTPHSPFRALPEDKALFANLNDASANHYGELVAMDRSIGRLRAKLRELGLAEKTLLVFNSDNGGLPGIAPETTGGLRGNKGTVFEGGLRVPGIIEWPGVIKPRVTGYPACTLDLFPTVADILGLPESVMIQPVDGISLRPLFTTEIATRSKAIAFRFHKQAALVDNQHKIVATDLSRGNFQIYDLAADPAEARDLSVEQPELAARLKKELLAWNESVEASFAGKDYPEGKVSPPDPESIAWTAHPSYQPFLAEWAKRWEYGPTIKGTAKGALRNGAPQKKQ